jgi:hypothetical protein
MRTAFFAVAVSLAALAGPAMALAADQGQVFNASRYNVVITVFISSQAENIRLATGPGDIEAGDSLTFDVPDVETIVRVRANHCAVQDPVFVARHRMQVILTAKCTLVVR